MTSPIYSLRLDESNSELCVYADCYYVHGFQLDTLQTSSDVLQALWEFSNQHPYYPAVVGAVVKSLRVLLVTDDERDGFGFKPAPLERWRGTRVNSGGSSKSVNQ